MEEASAVTAMRIVIENPALGRRVVTTVFPPSLAGAYPQSCSSGIPDTNPVVTDTSDTLRQTPRTVMWMRSTPRACHDRAEEVTFAY
ncbi:hypothetical protein Adi01nite_75770 [Amorphoplanes digitatis]|nr:hypothetical protein GCM10020092_019560 [Actinoplanes digitatis]GID98165.1 hypothetical protein Adi01nite_75770 [Actinoplanes digitatis]